MATAHDPDTARIDIGTLFSAVWRRKGRIFLATAGLLALTFVVLLFVPKMYESSASILVEQRDSTFLRASNDAGLGSSGTSVADDMAIASQVELIKSRDTLLAVIDSADLRAEPELNTASSGVIGLFLGLLGQAPRQGDITEIVLVNVINRLTVIQERDSRVISVLFRSESPTLAAKVANAIANTHVSRRAGLVVSDTADATKWLEIEIDKLRRKVADAESKVADFRIKNDLYSGRDGTSSLVDQQLSDIATQITQSQERQSTALSRAGVLRALIKAGKPIDSVPAVQDSAVINSLAQQKSELQNKKAELLARLLPSHPSVLAIEAQMDEIDSQMVAEGKRIADALDAEADIEARIEASLQDKLTQLKATASGDLTNGVTLAELDREAKSQRDLLETYLARYRDASSRTDAGSALPDVRVVTAAAPSVEPASPKTSLILIAVVVVSLAGQMGFVLFGELVSGRAIVEEKVREPEPEDAYVEPDPVATAPVEQYLPVLSRLTRSPAAPEPQQESTTAPQEAVAQGAPAAAEDAAGQSETDTSPDDRETEWTSEPEILPPPARPHAPRGTAELRSSQYVSRQAAASRVKQPSRGLPSTLKPLVDAIAAGRERVVLIGSLGDPAFAAGLVEQLGASCAALGLGVATIDAASGRPSSNPGLGDLLAGAASFGDVVHADRAGHLARVPWGRREQLDHRSSHGVTLAEALSDIYHVVLVATGLPGITSSLPVFAGTDAYVLIASDQRIDDETFTGLEAGAAALGFGRVQIVCANDDEMQVA
jgi:uncharacterized protein involved in exopolysaccharide biosynthesis